jgi:hypothetical protein
MKSRGTLLAVAITAVTLWGATTWGDELNKADTRPANKTFLANPNIFPIAVWLQDPARARRYRKIGINLYVGLWKGPTETQLAALKKHGMKVICTQNAIGLRYSDDPTIVAWMHGDEPARRRSREGIPWPSRRSPFTAPSARSAH